MAKINFPDSPTIGDGIFIGQYRYNWTGDSWQREILKVNDFIDEIEQQAQNIDAGDAVTVFSLADVTIDGGDSSGS